MRIEEKLLKYENHTILDRDILHELIREAFPNYKDASYRWVIYDMVKKGLISKLDSTQYIIGKSTIYRQTRSSDERNKIAGILQDAFPNVRFVVFESTLLNEWVNHQIARTIIFVQTEKYFMNDVFRILYHEYPTKAILNPTLEDLSIYDGELIIVSQLISQAPTNQKTREIKIEKLIVEFYTKDLITEFISDDEKDGIVAEIVKTYPVNTKTIFAYAKRRNNVDILKKVFLSHGFGETV